MNVGGSAVERPVSGVGPAPSSDSLVSLTSALNATGVLGAALASRTRVGIMLFALLVGVVGSVIELRPQMVDT